jgi:large subunit ribosomal protein L9
MIDSKIFGTWRLIMKVILKQDMKNLGKIEDLVNVSDGYARNFLIPRGIAVEATSSNVNVMNTRKEAERSKKDRELARAKTQAEKLKDFNLLIKAKSGENGKLFGSIAAKDIADGLKSSASLDIDRKKIQLHDAIKAIGTYEVEIKLYPGVSVKLNVKVEQE